MVERKVGEMSGHNSNRVRSTLLTAVLFAGLALLPSFSWGQRGKGQSDRGQSDRGQAQPDQKARSQPERAPAQERAAPRQAQTPGPQSVTPPARPGPGPEGPAVGLRGRQQQIPRPDAFRWYRQPEQPQSQGEGVPQPRWGQQRAAPSYERPPVARRQQPSQGDVYQLYRQRPGTPVAASEWGNRERNSQASPRERPSRSASDQQGRAKSGPPSLRLVSRDRSESGLVLAGASSSPPRPPGRRPRASAPVSQRAGRRQAGLPGRMW